MRVHGRLLIGRMGKVGVAIVFVALGIACALGVAGSGGCGPGLEPPQSSGRAPGGIPSGLAGAAAITSGTGAQASGGHTGAAAGGTSVGQAGGAAHAGASGQAGTGTGDAGLDDDAGH
jgi:hypothetical protein